MHLKVMTYNIRFNNPHDGRNAWPYRKAKVADLITAVEADIIGLQEVLQEQLEYLFHHLEGYQYVGVARDDGKKAGEYAPIFFRKDRFDLLESATFWLSETPEIAGSVGWDASLPRIASWAKLQDKTTGTNFLAMNTHFDHLGQEARAASARLLLERLKDLADADFIITGDFNAEPPSEAYKTLSSSLQDAYLCADTQTGSELSCKGFAVAATGVRIDYIFCSQGFKIPVASTLDTSHDGYYPSDHVPVVAELEL
ncbi:MAG: endonuclease/exonuclease/phosphatase family protein [Trueperaceae bacterium]|nr:endonuclease/exonuclease/phosphatase family protein [Trueperaceae bacterium]